VMRGTLEGEMVAFRLVEQETVDLVAKLKWTAR
jgi:hypothetical protein